MAGVAGEENTIASIMADQPAVHRKARQPDWLRQFRHWFQHLGETLAQQRQIPLRVRGPRFRILFQHGDQTPARRQRNRHQGTAGEQEAVALILRQIQFHIQIRQQEGFLVIHAFEGQAEQFPHPGMGTVRAHQDLRFHFGYLLANTEPGPHSGAIL